LRDVGKKKRKKNRRGPGNTHNLKNFPGGKGQKKKRNEGGGFDTKALVKVGLKHIYNLNKGGASAIKKGKKYDVD